jgi:hypothetical protein
MSRIKSVLIAFVLLFALALPAAAARTGPANERELASQSFALSWLWEGISRLWAADVLTDEGRGAWDPNGGVEGRGAADPDRQKGRGGWDPDGLTSPPPCAAPDPSCL